MHTISIFILHILKAQKIGIRRGHVELAWNPSCWEPHGWEPNTQEKEAAYLNLGNTADDFYEWGFFSLRNLSCFQCSTSYKSSKASTITKPGGLSSASAMPQMQGMPQTRQKELSKARMPATQGMPKGRRPQKQSVIVDIPKIF